MTDWKEVADKLYKALGDQLQLSGTDCNCGGNHSCIGCRSQEAMKMYREALRSVDTENE